MVSTKLITPRRRAVWLNHRAAYAPYHRQPFLLRSCALSPRVFTSVSTSASALVAIAINSVPPSRHKRAVHCFVGTRATGQAVNQQTTASDILKKPFVRNSTTTVLTADHSCSGNITLCNSTVRTTTTITSDCSVHDGNSVGNGGRGRENGGPGCGGGGGGAGPSHDGDGRNPDDLPYHNHLHSALSVLVVAAAATFFGTFIAPSPASAAANTTTTYSPSESAPSVIDTSQVVVGAHSAATRHPLASVTHTASSQPSTATPEAGGGCDNVNSPSQQQRLKRLMREAFSDLTEMRLRLEALETGSAAAADTDAAGEALVMPLEGFAVRPSYRALAPGLRLRCNAQVTGTVDAPVFLPLVAVDRTGPSDISRMGSESNLSQSSAGEGANGVTCSSGRQIPPGPADPSWSDILSEASLSCPTPPRLRLRIQSLWGYRPEENGNGTSITSAAAVVAPLSHRRSGGHGLSSAGAAGSQQQRGTGHEGVERTVAAHLQLGTVQGSVGGQLELEKLLLKAEAHPRLKFLLATHGGSLENIGKNVNPFAAGSGLQRGLTGAMLKGHDLALLSEGGAGAAVAAAAGDLSLAVGAFSPISVSSGGGHSPSSSSSPTASVAAQLSLHRSRRLALSGLWSSTTTSTTTTGPVIAGGACNGSDIGAAVTGRLTQSLGGSPAGQAAEDSWRIAGESERRVELGAVASAQLTEGLTAAIWGSQLLPPHRPLGGSCHGGHSSMGPLGPWADAAEHPHHHHELHPDGSQGTLGNLMQGVGGAVLQEQRLGLRLATVPDMDTGRSYQVSVSHRRRRVENPNGSCGVSPSESASVSVLMAELSAALPLAHGVMLTPGLVLLRRHAVASSIGGGCSGSDAFVRTRCSGQTLLLGAVRMTWSF